MKQESGDLTAAESLDIIAAMINEAKRNVRTNHFFFLFWGWVIVAANLGVYILQQLGYERPYLVWGITIPAWLYTLYKGFTRKKVPRTTTHFDRISRWLWMTFGLATFTLVFFGFRINYQLNAVILVVASIPTVVSGVILRFRPLVYGGIVFWVAGVVNFLIPMATQPLVGAVAIVCGYLIPGYRLKRKAPDV
jgi:hypothetical protein